MAHLHVDDDYEDIDLDASHQVDADGSKVDKKNIKEWIFTVNDEHLQHSHAPNDNSWITNISLFARRANKNFKFCKLVQDDIDQNLREQSKTQAIRPRQQQELDKQKAAAEDEYNQSKLKEEKLNAMNKRSEA